MTPRANNLAKLALSAAIFMNVLVVATSAKAYGLRHAQRAAASAAGGFECGHGCTFAVRPVCGEDGNWYQNECLAICSGHVKPGKDATLCGGKPLPFMDMRPGPPGAESAPLNASALTVPPAVLTQYLAEGFRYAGRIRLAREAGPRPSDAAAQGAEGVSGGAAGGYHEPPRGPDGDWHVKAVRCTSDGDLYVGSIRVPGSKTLKLESYIPPWLRGGAAADQAGAGANLTVLQTMAASFGLVPAPSTLRAARGGSGGASGRAAQQQQARVPAAVAGDAPSWLKGAFSRARAFFASAAAASLLGAPDAPVAHWKAGAGAGSAPATAAPAADADSDESEDEQTVPTRAQAEAGYAAHARALKELVGGDDRGDCERGFPYTAIGQIQTVDSTGLYICTGTLIAPDKVLTAGHCVWNVKRGAFYYNLNYAPGRWRDAGRIVNPWGVVPWKSVTVFDSFKRDPTSMDVAVVTLAKPLGSLTGYMGLASGCGRNLQLTTAGYPQDKAPGTCMASSCGQRALDCAAPTNVHTCDTKSGMSGAPLWDGKNRVRLIHVAGVEGRPENRGTTLTQFLVNTIAKW